MNFNKFLKKSLSILVFSFLITSCATSYNNIQPNLLNYNSKIITDSVEIGYSYGVMKKIGNRKQVKKSKRKNLNVIAIEIKNKSNKTIHFNKDIQLSTYEGKITPVSPKESYKKINQSVASYLLALFRAEYRQSLGGHTEVFVGLNFYGAIYAIPNMIIANKGNRQLEKDLTTYSSENLIVAPNETKYGIISFYGENELKIFLDKFKKSRILNEDVVYLSPFRFDIASIFFTDTTSSVDEYCESLEKYLRKDDNFRELKIQKEYYYNGNLKSIGILSLHESVKGSFLNKIGTWHFYHESGIIRDIIDYNHRQEYHGRFLKYDRNGILLNQDEYKNNKRLK